MSDTTGDQQGTPVNNGWQGLRVGQVPPTSAPPRPVVPVPPAPPLSPLPLPSPLPVNVAARTPVPVESIPYARAGLAAPEPEPRWRRPGGLTALGVVSIVMGAL